MKDKRRSKQKDTTRVAFFFFALVFSLIAISLVLKIVSVVQRSSFDGGSSFVIGYERIENGKRDPDKTIVSFDPNEKSITLLQVSSPVSVDQSAYFLKIPLDKTVTHADRSIKEALRENDAQLALRESVLRYASVYTDMTLVDFIRLWIFVSSVTSSSTTIREIAFQEQTEATGKMSDELVSQLFADSKIIEEKASIEVVNAADISGLGTSIGRFVTNMGGNVVAVSTSPKSVRRSSIAFFGEESYTVKRLTRYFGFEKKLLTKPGIADIVIELGTDVDKYRPGEGI